MWFYIDGWAIDVWMEINVRMDVCVFLKKCEHLLQSFDTLPEEMFSYALYCETGLVQIYTEIISIHCKSR